MLIGSGRILAFTRQYRIDLPSLPLEKYIHYDWNMNGLAVKN
jgi:hypothetical protein